MNNNFRPRWYGRFNGGLPQGRVQIDTAFERPARQANGNPTLPEHVLRLADAEYQRQYSGQDYERMQERGGLSWMEVVMLLADHLERLGAKPSQPRELKQADTETNDPGE